MVSFTAAQVASHDTPSDCWVVVNAKVYNVTEMVPKHPGSAAPQACWSVGPFVGRDHQRLLISAGGDMILIRAGADATQLFESYHSTTAW